MTTIIMIIAAGDAGMRSEDDHHGCQRRWKCAVTVFVIPARDMLAMRSDGYHQGQDEDHPHEFRCDSSFLYTFQLCQDPDALAMRSHDYHHPCWRCWGCVVMIIIIMVVAAGDYHHRCQRCWKCAVVIKISISLLEMLGMRTDDYHQGNHEHHPHDFRCDSSFQVLYIYISSVSSDPA